MAMDNGHLCKMIRFLFESEDVPLCYDSEKKATGELKGSQASVGCSGGMHIRAALEVFLSGHTPFLDGVNKETHQHQSSRVKFSYPIR